MPYIKTKHSHMLVNDWTIAVSPTFVVILHTLV